MEKIRCNMLGNSHIFLSFFFLMNRGLRLLLLCRVMETFVCRMWSKYDDEELQ